VAASLRNESGILGMLFGELIDEKTEVVPLGRVVFAMPGYHPTSSWKSRGGLFGNR